ncbi:hypothetical protein [Nocardia terpenica]|uniref:RHIM domain-containing protein n=1 Tax=Nocardia terpenica TaxID=455432 RepID=A0A291RPT3_9NOCA|nr:hypothetical protein [Nocardia terpenica]ATL69279.1 hypothetical protein CRH09_27000 [Nocardia terpenica]
MTGVELVAAALTAGAAAGLTDTAHAAVRDAYAGLLSAVRKTLRRTGDDDSVLDQQISDPADYHRTLVDALTAADAGDDPDLLARSRTVLARLDPSSLTEGRYVIDLRGAQGVQVGDNPTMTLNF